MGWAKALDPASVSELRLVTAMDSATALHSA
jgi:hypothetical protein